MVVALIYDAFDSIVEIEEEDTIQKIGSQSSSSDKIVRFIGGHKIKVEREDKSRI